MGFRRGTLTAAALAALSLCACTAQASHPRALGSAPGSAAPSPFAAGTTAGTATPTDSGLAGSPSVRPASPIASLSPNGTPPSSAAVSPGVLSSADIATGVRATANEFFADLNIAFATGDVSKVEAITSPACGCRSLINTIKSTYAKHQRILGVSATVKSLAVVSFVTAGATADVHYEISAGRIVDANGTQVNTSVEDPDEHSAMFVTSEHGSWIIQQNTLLNGSAG